MNLDYLWTYDDGGRKEAGFPITPGTQDCVTRSISIVTGKPYEAVHKELEHLCQFEKPSQNTRQSHPETGIKQPIFSEYLFQNGFNFIGSPAIPISKKKALVHIQGHATAWIDGYFHDTFDPNVLLKDQKKIYGYYYRDDDQQQS